MAALAELTVAVTEAPFALSMAHRKHAMAAGLSQDDLLHAVMLSAFFGHLNRIADAVAVPLDYEVQLKVPPVDRSAPALAEAQSYCIGRPAFETMQRPETARALLRWRTHAFERDAPLTRRQRTLIARWVAHWLGDGSISSPLDLTANPLDGALRDLAQVVTLAPWTLSERSFTALRTAGLDDAALFDVCATASAAGVFSRIEVALVALGK